MGNQPVTPRVRKAPGATAKYRPSPQASKARTYGCGVGCYLHRRTTFEPIPIEKVDVSVNVVHSLVEITVMQLYHNDSTSPMECTFEFNIGDNTVLSSLSVVVNDKTIRAKVQEKEEAFATYDDAISSGSGAYLLESTDKSNRYKLNVGNLPPGQKAEVHFAFVSPLTASHDGWLFSVPETIFPTHRSYLSSIEGRVDVGEEVSAIEVLSEHPIKTDATGFKYTHEEPSFGISSEINFCIKLKSLSPTRETTNASAQDLTKPALVIEHHLHDPTLFSTMLDFRPIFSSNTPELASDYEFVVLADCGGGMYGPKMAQQINALKLLVHSLPSGCKFNLVTVSENYVSQWQSSVVLDEDNMKKALWSIEHLSADRGGETRLRAALNSVYVRRDYLRNLCVFVLTAVDYSSEARAISKLVSANAVRNSRLFAIGFGDEVDTELLNGLAFAGRGRAHFVKDDDFVDGILFQQLVAAFAPRVRDIKVTWNLDSEAKAKFIDQAPLHVPITASGASTVVYGLFEVPIPDGVVIPPPEDPAALKKKQSEDDAKSKSPTVSKATSSANLPSSSDAVSDAVATAVTTSGTSKSSSTNVSGKKSKTPIKTETSSLGPASGGTTPKSARKHAKKGEEPVMVEVPKPTLFPGLKLPITGVTITGIGPDEKELKWEISASEASFRGMNRMIRCKAAAAVCQEYTTAARTALMSPEQIKLKITDISTRFQVISKYTSFVAVEERDGDATDAAMKQVTITANEKQEPIDTTTTPIVTPPKPIGIPYYHHRPIRPQIPIYPTRHWVPPPPPAPSVHYAPQRNLTIKAEKSTYNPSFSSDKSRKKMSKDRGDMIVASPRSSSSSGFSDSYASSLLGFSLCQAECDDYNDMSLYGEQLDEIVMQAPPQYRLAASGLAVGGSAAPAPAAPAPAPASFLVAHDSSISSHVATSKDEEDMSSEEEADNEEAKLDAPKATLSAATLGEVSLGKKVVPRRENETQQEMAKEKRRPVLKAKTANSAYDNDTMIPNKSNLSHMSYAAPPPPAEKHYVSLQPPTDWKFTTDIMASESQHVYSTPASRLRAIVNAQHADGSWDLDSVSKFLKLDRASMETANPLALKHTKGDDKKGRKAKKDAAHESESTEPSSSTTAAPIEGAFNPSDLWATALLLAHLKRSYDAERDFWTFVALKVAALLAKAIPDEAARSSLVKKAKKYLDSLPIAISSNISVSP